MSSTQAANFHRLAAGVYLEGLAVDYARSIVWYSDVIAGGVHGVTFERREVHFLQYRENVDRRHPDQ